MVCANPRGTLMMYVHLLPQIHTNRKCSSCYIFGHIQVLGVHLLCGVLRTTGVLERPPASTLKPATSCSYVVCKWSAAMAMPTTSASAAPITTSTTSWVEATINKCWWTVETSLGHACPGRKGAEYAAHNKAWCLARVTLVPAERAGHEMTSYPSVEKGGRCVDTTPAGLPPLN
jgi:hypothetical protein